MEFAGIVIGGILLFALCLRYVVAQQGKPRKELGNAREQEELAFSRWVEANKPLYERMAAAHRCPADAKIVSLEDPNHIEAWKQGVRIWVMDATLHLLSPWEEVENTARRRPSLGLDQCAVNIRIPLEKIYLYEQQGDFYTETHLSGGGGGGVNVQGAVVGGILAGQAGAILGGRQAVEPIRSRTAVRDTRRTVLYYYNGEDRDLSSLTFHRDSHHTLFQVLPDKERSFVVSRG